MIAKKEKSPQVLENISFQPRPPLNHKMDMEKHEKRETKREIYSDWETAENIERSEPRASLFRLSGTLAFSAFLAFLAFSRPAAQRYEIRHCERERERGLILRARRRRGRSKKIGDFHDFVPLFRHFDSIDLICHVSDTKDWDPRRRTWAQIFRMMLRGRWLLVGV